MARLQILCSSAKRTETAMELSTYQFRVLGLVFLYFKSLLLF